MIERAGPWRMSVTAQHHDDPRTDRARARPRPTRTHRRSHADGHEAVDAEMIGDGQRIGDPIGDGATGFRSGHPLPRSVDADEPRPASDAGCP